MCLEGAPSTDKEPPATDVRLGPFRAIMSFAPLPASSRRKAPTHVRRSPRTRSCSWRSRSASESRVAFDEDAAACAAEGRRRIAVNARRRRRGMRDRRGAGLPVDDPPGAAAGGGGAACPFGVARTDRAGSL